MKKIMAFALCLVLALSLCACGGTTTEEPTTPTEAAVSDLDYVTANGKLVIGYTLYEPMNYIDSNNEFVGFDTEFAQAVCEKLGVEPDFVEINWDNKILELNSKGIDCIWNGMTISEEILKNADVTDPYVKNAQVLVTNKDVAANYTTVDSIADLTFAVEADSAGASVLADTGLDLDVTEVNAQTDALLEVMSGSVEACVIDITMANAMIGEGTSYDTLAVAMELSTEEYGIAFRTGSDLTAKVNEIIAELMEDGTMDTLAEKYSLTLVK